MIPTSYGSRIVPNETPDLRPFWSVLIPAYNPRADYLEKTLWSVLQQDPGAEQMQIEVVDDCSSNVDVETLVKSIAGPRVKYSNTQKNLGLAGCWNTCIERSRGEWVHILHQDDYVLPGFYQTLAENARSHPEVSLVATRSFIVDGEGVITGVTERLRRLEKGGREVDNLFYANPIQCPAVVVKREFYENHGGFRLDLTYTLDCEMWARVIGSAGGLVVPEVLACYRFSEINETTRLIRTAAALRDLEKVNELFARRYPTFDRKRGTQSVCDLALTFADRFFKKGDTEAAKANLDYWKTIAPISLRLRRLGGGIRRRIFKL